MSQFRSESGLPRDSCWALLSAAQQEWYRHAVAGARRGLLPRDVHDAWRATRPLVARWDDLDAATRQSYVLVQMVVVALDLPFTTQSGVITMPPVIPG